MASVFQRVLRYFSIVEFNILKAFQFQFPAETLAPAYAGLPKIEQNQSFNLNDLLNDAVVWAVPKKRKTIEKRRSKNFGCYPSLKMLVPQTHILICPQCGTYCEPKTLCPTCYNKVKQVTREMQDSISANLGVSPVEEEVVVLYQGEKQNPEFHKGKRIVEINKPRPQIFCNNLLQGSTQKSSESKSVATTDNISQT